MKKSICAYNLFYIKNSLFFHILPYMHWIPKEKKNEFHENVDRQSVKSKIEYLVAQSENLIEISKHEFRLQ